MAVQASDIKARLSTQSGSAGDTTASTPADSIGGYISTTDLVDAAVENLFANVSSADAATGRTYYRCVFLYNSHASQTWEAVRVWLESQTAGGGDLTMGLDPAGAVAVGASSGQAEEPADQYTAPDGVVFSNPTSYDDGIVIGDLEDGECIAVWFRLAVPPDVAALNLDTAIWAWHGISDP